MYLQQLVLIQAGSVIPLLSPDQVAKAIYDLDQLGQGCKEIQMIMLLLQYVFPQPQYKATYAPTTGLWAAMDTVMSRHLLPPQRTSACRLSTPRPHLLMAIQ